MELIKRLDVKRPGIRAWGDMIGIPLPNILDGWASHTGRCEGATAEKAVPFPSDRPSILLPQQINPGGHHHECRNGSTT